MKRNLLKTLLLGAIFGAAAMIMPTDIIAQGQLRYQIRYSKADVSRIISKLEESSNTFRRDFDRAMDRSNLNGTSTEDRYNGNVRDYENSLDRLRRAFDRNNSWWDTRNDVSNVLSSAQTVNTMMNSISFRRNLERQWTNMRNDLNTLADTYDMPGVEGGGWNGGGVWGGVWGGGNVSNPPNWAQGTFYGTGPDGSQIPLTIDGQGYVTAVIGGNSSRGTYYRGSLYINGASSSVSQSGNGIRTTRNDNREVINYSRNSSGGNWGNNGGNNGGNWGNNGRVSTPPSWAVGTFYGTGPDGSQIALTIDGQGYVNATVGGNSNRGTYYNGTININGANSRVSKWGNGIRTTRSDNREVINYTRNNTGGNWGNNGIGVGNRPTSWAIGTFNARNPQSGGTIFLTITSEGQVTVNMDGNMSYGTMSGSTLTINGISSTVTRDGNGIRTTRNDNGERIDYRRN